MSAGQGVPPLATDARTPAAGNGNGDGGSLATQPAPVQQGAPEARTSDGGARRPGGHLAYNPALDGIRGLAVGAVLLFHGGFSWARGGYLGGPDSPAQTPARNDPKDRNSSNERPVGCVARLGALPEVERGGRRNRIQQTMDVKLFRLGNRCKTMAQTLTRRAKRERS